MERDAIEQNERLRQKLECKTVKYSKLKLRVHQLEMQRQCTGVELILAGRKKDFFQMDKRQIHQLISKNFRQEVAEQTIFSQAQAAQENLVIKQALGQLQTELDKLEHRSSAHLNDLQKQLAEKELQLQALRSELPSLQSKEQDSWARLRIAEQEHARQIEQAQDKQKSLISTIECLQQKLLRLESCEQRSATQKDEHKGLLGADLNNTTQKDFIEEVDVVGSLRDELEEANKQLGLLTQSSLQYQARLQQAEGQLQSERRLLQEARQEMASREEQHLAAEKWLKMEMEELMSKMISLESIEKIPLAEGMTSLQDLELEGFIHPEFFTVKEELQKHKERIFDLEDMVETYDYQLKECRIELARSNERGVKLEELAASCEERFTRLQEQMLAYKKQGKEMELAAVEARIKLEKKQVELQSREEEVDELREHIASLNTRLQGLLDKKEEPKVTEEEKEQQFDRLLEDIEEGPLSLSREDYETVLGKLREKEEQLEFMRQLKDQFFEQLIQEEAKSKALQKNVTQLQGANELLIHLRSHFSNIRGVLDDKALSQHQLASREVICSLLKVK